jgi:hypothetical protein
MAAALQSFSKFPFIIFLLQCDQEYEEKQIHEFLNKPHINLPSSV